MNYLICEKNHFTHFFYSKNKGICYKIKKGNFFGENIILYKNGLPGFSVYCDHDFNIHLICTDKQNNIVYFTKRNNIWRNFIISESIQNLIPLEFKITAFNGFLNFFYSALLESRTILVHCILNHGAMPEIIAELSHDYPHFHANNGKIYYTTKKNILGFKNFSDGKCDIFSPVAKDGIMPFSLVSENIEFLCYKKNNTLFFNSDPVFSDLSATLPIIIKNKNKISLMWKSNNFLRYITSFNNGATWSSPMRFINGEPPELFTIFANCKESTFYGHNKNKNPHIYEQSGFAATAF